MIESAQIDFDFPCQMCGYNLHGLPAGHKCPECGHSVLASLSAGDPVDWYDRQDALRRSAIRPLAQRLGCAVDGLLFVYDALMLALRPAQNDRKVPSRLDALAVCRSVQGLANRYFNDRDEAAALLDEWGVRTSADVGVMIREMAEAGFILREDVDLSSSFDSISFLESGTVPDATADSAAHHGP